MSTLQLLGTDKTNLPRAGQSWVHNKKGTVYLIITVANLEGCDLERFPPMVVYGDSLGRIWARPLKVFREKFSNPTVSDIDR